MGLRSDHEAIMTVIRDYLEGMIWGDEARLRRAFHPGALQIGHFAGAYEFFPLPDFIDWLNGEASEPEGTPYTSDLISMDVTGSVAVVKITDTCFDTNFTDYLVLVNDRADGKGHWQIVTKAYHANAGRGATPPAKI